MTELSFLLVGSQTLFLCTSTSYGSPHLPLSTRLRETMVRKEVEEINIISDATRFSLGRKVRGDGVLLEQPEGL